jgi:competence protein ComEC
LFTYWLLLAFFLFCLGDVFSFYEMQKAFRCCSGLFLLFGTVCLCKKCKKEYLLCGLCCFLVLAGGFLAGTGKLETQKRWQTLIGKMITLQGAVEPDSIRRKEQGISAVFAAEWPLRGKVRIFVKTDPKSTDLTVRKLLTGKNRIGGVLKEPVFLRNPGTYDGYHFNKIKGIYGNITVSPVQLQESGEPLPLRFRFTALAQKVRENALAQLHTGTGAILPGMVLGGYQGVAPEEADVFRDNGIAHLLAVSGTHVAVLTLILQALLRPAGSKGIIFIQLFLALYALLCGLQPAVLRAVAMACVLLWGRSRKLKADSVRLLLLTAWALLLANPFWLFDISFQLSFVTTAGLLLAGPKVNAYIPQKLPDWLRTVLGVTLTAQIFSFPFSVYYFHRVSLIGLVSNLLLLPALELAALLFLAGLCVLFLESAGGVLCGLFVSFAGDTQQGSNMFAMIASLPFSAAERLLQGAAAAGKLLADLPFAALDVAGWNKAGYFCYLGFIASFFDLGPFSRLSSRQRNRWLGVMFCTFLLIHAARYLLPQDLTVHFMDVGQGDAALIRTPAGKNILIDTGGLQGDADISRMVLLPYLRYLGVKQIDALCLSHGDHDHAGGAAGVAARLPVKNVFLGAGAEKSADVQALLKVVEHKANVYRLQKGEQWNVGDCRIAVASASSGTSSASGKTYSSSAVTDTNASSLVLQLFCRGHSLVFSGDAGMDTEENAMRLLRTADVLKVSHHGSETSSSPHFLDHVKPRLAIISCGKHNRYGHPAQGTLERLAARTIIPLRTDELGAIKVVFDKNTLRWYSFRYHENQF